MKISVRVSDLYGDQRFDDLIDHNRRISIIKQVKRIDICAVFVENIFTQKVNNK